MKTKQAQKKVHFSTGQEMNKNYYNLCIVILQRAEQDFKGCSVLYRGSRKEMLNEIETARQSAEVFFNNSVTIHHKKFSKNRHYPLFKEIQM